MQFSLRRNHAWVSAGSHIKIPQKEVLPRAEQKGLIGRRIYDTSAHRVAIRVMGIRRKIDHFSDLPISPQRRYSLRNRAMGSCARCQKSSPWHYLCDRHRHLARRAEARRKKRNVSRLADYNADRRRRYGELRAMGISASNARRASGSERASHEAYLAWILERSRRKVGVKYKSSDNT